MFPSLSGLLLAVLFLASCKEQNAPTSTNEPRKTESLEEKSREPTPDMKSKSPEKAVPASPAYIAAVSDGAAFVPGVILKDVPVQEKPTLKLPVAIIAKLANATLQQEVYFYLQTADAKAAPRQSGIVTGFDATGELTIITPSETTEGILIPTETQPGSKLTLWNIEVSKAEIPVGNSDAQAQETREMEETKLADRRDELLLELKSLRGSTPRAAPNPRSRGPMPFDPPQDTGSPRMLEITQELRQIGGMKRRPPLFVNYSIVSKPEAEMSEGMAVRSSEDLPYLDIYSVKSRRPQVSPLAGVLVAEPQIKSASYRFEITQGLITVIGSLDTIAGGNSRQIDQLIIPYSELREEGLLTADPPVSIQGEEGSQSGSLRSFYLNSASAAANSLRHEVKRSPIKTKERFIGQHVMVDKKGNKTYMKPFGFTVQEPPALPVEIESHPYVSLASSGVREDEPSSLVSGHHLLKASSKIIDWIPLCSGDLLAVSMESAPFLKFINVKNNTWHEPISPQLEEPILIASQEDLLFIMHPTRGILERWNITTGVMEKAVLIETEGPVQQMAAPIANPQGLICLMAGNRPLFLDPETLKPVISATPAETQSGPAAKRTQVNASGDGFAYAIVGEVNGPTYSQTTGISYESLENYKGYFRYAYEPKLLGASASSSFPRPNGLLTFVSPDPYGSCWLNPTSKQRAAVVEFPAETPEFDLLCSMPSSKDPVPIAKIGSLSELRPLPESPELEGPPNNRRKLLLMNKRKLVTLAASRTEIHLRDLDLTETVAGKGCGVILSSPASYARRGELFRYQLVCSAKSSPKFSLKQAPSGTLLSPSGLLEWPIDPLFEPQQADFSVTVETGGESQLHNFQVRLLGPGPGFVSLASNTNSEGRIAVPAQQIILPSVLVRPKIAGAGRYLIGTLNWPKPYFVVLDLAEAKISAMMPLAKDYYEYVANRDFVYFIDKERTVIEARNLKDLKLTASLKFQGVTCALSTGYASTAPLFLVQNESGDNVSPLTLAALDPVTLAKSPLSVEPDIEERFPKCFHRHGINEMAASPNGDVFELLGSGLAAKRFELRGGEITNLSPISPQSETKIELIERLFAEANPKNQSDGSYTRRLFRSSTGASSNLILSSSSFVAFAPGREDLALVMRPLMECNTMPSAFLIDDAGYLVGTEERAVLIYPWAPQVWFQHLTK